MALMTKAGGEGRSDVAEGKGRSRYIKMAARINEKRCTDNE
jgi:hypothetical protein